VLAKLRALEPEARLGTLVWIRQPGEPLLRAASVGAEAVHLHVGLASGPAIRAAHDAGLRVHVYTVDAPEVQLRLRDDGCDGIFTNAPGKLRALLARQ
jgi:glycerophosphoryl diester phosphodiesterase